MCLFVCMFSKNVKFCDIAVTAPAGFPDHPHRGFKIGLFFLILFCSREIFFAEIYID